MFRTQFKRGAFEWVLARSASAKQKDTRKECPFLREFATRGKICALRSLYSAESLLLRVTQDTATGGMRTSPYDFLSLLLLCYGEVRIHGGSQKQKDTR